VERRKYKEEDQEIRVERRWFKDQERRAVGLPTEGFFSIDLLYIKNTYLKINYFI